METEKIKRLYLEEKLSVREVAEKTGISFWSLYNFMQKNRIPRRLPSEANYIVNRNKPRFMIKKISNLTEDKLRVAGIMLYWAEGTLKGNTVDFANSNPEMVKIFLRFLREICGVNESRLRAYLYLHSHQKIYETKTFWHKVTNISLDQFTKPYVRKANLNLSKRTMPNGLIHIRYNDKRLLQIINSWIESYISSFTIRAGTQAAKGDRLFKAASCRKAGWKSR